MVIYVKKDVEVVMELVGSLFIVVNRKDDAFVVLQIVYTTKLEEVIVIVPSWKSAV